MVSEATINEEVFALNEEGLREALLARNLEITGKREDLCYRLAHARYVEEGIDEPPAQDEEIESEGAVASTPAANNDPNTNGELGVIKKVRQVRRDKSKNREKQDRVINVMPGKERRRSKNRSGDRQERAENSRNSVPVAAGGVIQRYLNTQDAPLLHRGDGRVNVGENDRRVSSDSEEDDSPNARFDDPVQTCSGNIPSVYRDKRANERSRNLCDSQPITASTRRSGDFRADERGHEDERIRGRENNYRSESRDFGRKFSDPEPMYRGRDGRFDRESFRPDRPAARDYSLRYYDESDRENERRMHDRDAPRRPYDDRVDRNYRSDDRYDARDDRRDNREYDHYRGNARDLHDYDVERDAYVNRQRHLQRVRGEDRYDDFPRDEPRYQEFRGDYRNRDFDRRGANPRNRNLRFEDDDGDEEYVEFYERRGQGREQDQSRRITNAFTIMNKWNLKFSGSQDEDPEEFIRKIGGRTV